MDFIKLTIATILLLFALWSCSSKYKAYVFIDKNNFKRKQIGGTQLPTTIENGKILKHYDFKIPNEIDVLDSLIPYANSVFKKTQKKEFHSFVDKKEFVQLNDSIILIKFMYPRTIHGEKIFRYNKKNRVITYFDVYYGKL